MTSECRTKYEGPRLVGYARQNTKARVGERQMRYKPSFGTTQEFPIWLRLECRGLEEVKSTVQARYTTTYIVYEDVCETQTYDVS